MALIKCPECKKKVSDQCGRCPNCGFPIEVVEKSITASNDNAIDTDIVVEKETEQSPKERKPINKKLLIGIISAAVVLLTVSGVLVYNALLPRINATKEFNAVVKLVEQKNSELEKAIVKSEELIAKKQPLLDETLVSKLENSISDTKAVKITDFKKPKTVEEIISRSAELNKVDYSTAIQKLSENHTALEINAKRYQLVNHPTEAYVIQCLKTIPEITGISAVTEDNDPNGNLNKPGGYTSTVYFSHEKLKLDKFIYGDTLIEQGTDAGGAIEVYTCVEDAVKRRDYLAVFDGSITASGTHTVIGTVLVRTSNELTASQQKEFEAKLITALTYIKDIDDKKETTTTTEQKPTETKPSSSKPTTTTTTTTEQKPTETKPSSSKPTTTTTTTAEQKPTETKPSSSKPTTTTTTKTEKPKNRKQEAVEEAVNQAKLWFPTDRHFIEYILVNPSLEEGFEGFTESEAEYAINNAKIDWKKHALQTAKDLLDNNVGVDFSQRDIYSDVEDSGGADCMCAGFTETELQYAVDNCGINWKQKVIEDMKAYGYKDYSVVITAYDFMDHLTELGYNDSTIEYAMDNTSGYYRGEAVENEQERVKLLLSYGYTREAIINWYSEDGMDYSEAEALVDSCI